MDLASRKADTASGANARQTGSSGLTTFEEPAGLSGGQRAGGLCNACEQWGLTAFAVRPLMRVGGGVGKLHNVQGDIPGIWGFLYFGILVIP